MESVIELIGLSKEFDGIKAVDDLYLNIEKGQIISLLGPSGCGKTTTLRMMAGFETPTNGRILLHGNDIINLPARERNMGMVFQNYALFPHMTVEENIGFGLLMRHENKQAIAEKVKKHLSLVKLEGYEKRKPSQLSGGQQQRVALARALITEPHLLLMDEPFGALDKKLRETMQLEIRNILKSVDTTAVFVTHDQEEALVLSDKIVVMNQGRIEQIATPKEIYEKPETLFVANFIGVSNEFCGVVETKGSKQFLCTHGGHRLCFKGDYKEYQNDEKKNFFIVRPEKITPVQSDLDCINASNCIRGKIENVKYFGTVTQYYLDINEQKPLILDCQNINTENAWSIGDACSLYIDPTYLNAVYENNEYRNRRNLSC